jgi:hypothetical protein
VEKDFIVRIKMATRSASPKPKQKRHQGELARTLARKKVICPVCGKYMAVATLQYTHVCAGAAKEPNEEEIQRRFLMAKNRAIAGFLQRHGVQDNNDPLECTRANDSMEHTQASIPEV